MSVSFRFISAGAGSGKTYRLTALLHEMLTTKVVRPEGVLATTFTNKAAAELRERVRTHLMKQGEFACATAIGQARIGTVNSVCGNLLMRFAFEAGMPMEQRVLDEPRSAQLLNESIDEVIDGESLRTLIQVTRRLSLDRKPYGEVEIKWRTALRNIVSQARANAIEPTELRTFGAENARQLLAQFPTVSQGPLDAALRVAIQEALPVIRHASKIGKEVKKTTDYLSLLEVFSRTMQDDDARWTQWSKLANSEPGKKLLDTVQPIQDAAGEHARHPRLRQDLTTYLDAIFSLAADVLEVYAQRKRQLGAVDFTDQECELLKILDLPAVEETLTAELDLLMVDEFQDTSPIQLALFLKLARFARHVVWVGDVKQAIYGFRGGDARLMSAVVRTLPAIDVIPEALQTSWRSRPALVAFVNQVFGEAFEGLKAVDVELHADREEFGGINAVEDWILDGKVADQHQGIASGIAALLGSGAQIIDRDTKLARPVRLGDIAVLTRSNETVKALAGVLQAAGIMASTEQPGLLERPEIVLALACVRRLNDERDTVATAEILSVAACEEPDHWLAERLQFLKEGGTPHTWREEGENPHPIFAAIRSLRTEREHFSPQEAVQLLIARCHLGSRALQWQYSPERARLRLANLDRLGELAGEYEEECHTVREAATLSGFLLYLQELERKSADTMPQPAVDAVQVMTHHAAKGLEWPVVVLVDLAGDVWDSLWDSVRAESLHTFDVLNPLKERFLRYWPWPYGEQSKVPLLDEVEASATGQALRAAAVEEHKRLLYVSMTRARDLLVFARQKRRTEGEWMGTVGLAQHLPTTDGPTLTLRDRSQIPFLRRNFYAISRPSLSRPTIQDELLWFPTPDRLTVRLPLTVNPSMSVPAGATVAEKDRIGARIPIHGTPDPAALGEAIHACLAAYLSTPTALWTQGDVAAILERMGVPGSLPSEALLGQLAAVQEWVNRRWPAARLHVETPITRALAGGQVMNGRIDLLLETNDGWILIDHKSGAQNSMQHANLAAQYGGQLAAYADSIEAVTGMPVVQTWLVLAVSGSALRIDTRAGTPNV
jgi:ATP-dependent exoDNAse (exonuclease V) beta subunit